MSTSYQFGTTNHFGPLCEVPSVVCSLNTVQLLQGKIDDLFNTSARLTFGGTT